MRSIKVEPEQLESCAARIEEKNQEYQRNCSNLFQACEVMSAAWQGEDNIAFTNQIAKYQPDFQQLAVLCGQYAEFLRAAARSYRSTQDELIAQAGRL